MIDFSEGNSYYFEGCQRGNVNLLVETQILPEARVKTKWKQALLSSTAL